MNNRYQNLLSPIQVGGALFRNRMTATAALPHFVQGTEPWPTEKWITMMANRARNGASAVYINHLEGGSKMDVGLSFVSNGPGPIHFSIMDVNNSATHNYLCQMIDAIRYYGAIPMTGPIYFYSGLDRPGIHSFGPGSSQTDLYSSSAGLPGGGAPGMGGPPPGAPGASGAPGALGMPGGMHEGENPPPMQGGMDRHFANTFTKKQMQEYIDSSVESARNLKSLGFEMMSVHNAYRGSPAAQLWSPLCNQRTDEYGGSVINRARLLLELFDALKQELGRDYPLECLISGEEAGGVTVEDTIELARLAEGKIDLLSIRTGEQDPQHPTGFTSTRQNPCPNIDVCAAVKEDVMHRGGKILIGATAGLHDPDYSEKILREKKADVICMARSWICDPEYGKKLYAGHGEDVIPCVRCNKCHVPNDSDKFRSFCTVNPVIGLEDKLERMIEPVEKIKQVAVVGGGPGGMYAAITCAKRGHHVTLFEKEAKLGGQLCHTDYASFKWPLADFKNYLIKQCYQNGVKIRLNTTVTKELLENSGDYDDVIVAIGPTLKKPSVPGVDGENVVFAVDCFDKSATLPKYIAVIGGSETGVEIGMHLAELGHEVTVMTRQSELATDAPHAHYVSMLRDAFEKQEGVHKLTGVRYTSFDSEGVTYIDADGTEKKLKAELIILATGADRNVNESAALSGVGQRTWYVGDCYRVGNVHMAITSGFGTANQI